VWGLMVGLGIALGAWLMVRAARRRGLPEDRLWTLVLVAGAAGILGSRVLWALQPGELAGTLADPLSIVSFWRGGLTFIGGLVAATAAGLVYARRARLPIPQTADLAAMGLWFGLAIGRLGCFITGLHPGRETGLPWGIDYLGAVRHPIPLYESLFAVALFLLARALLRRGLMPGSTMLLTVSVYLVGRGLLDLLRLPAGQGADPRMAAGLTLTQTLALAATPVLLGWLLMLRRRSVHPVP